MFGVPGEGALVDRDIDRKRERDEDRGGNSGEGPQQTGRAGGRDNRVRTINTEVSGSRTGITRPNVRSMPCCILICGVSSSRATTGCSSAQDADSAPTSQPLSSTTNVLRTV
jgi:hypothetical protein